MRIGSRHLTRQVPLTDQSDTIDSDINVDELLQSSN